MQSHLPLVVSSHAHSSFIQAAMHLPPPRYNEGKSVVLRHYSAAMRMSSRNTVSATLWISLIHTLISKGVCWIALCVGDCWVHRVWLWNMPTLLLVNPGILHKKLWKNSHSQKLFVEMKQSSTNEKNTFTDKHHIPSICDNLCALIVLEKQDSISQYINLMLM